MLPTIFIGPLSLPTGPFLILFGLWLGMVVSEKKITSTTHNKISTRQLNDWFGITLIVGVVSARLAYAAQYPRVYLEHPLTLLSIQAEGLDVLAGSFFGFITGLVYCQRKNISIWHLLDAITPLLMVMSVCIPLANFASGDAFGSITHLPWSIYLWGADRHPVQLYQFLLNLVVLAVFWPGKSFIKTPGILFLTTTGALSFVHLILESFRGQAQVLFSGVRSVQVIAWIIIALCVFTIQYRQNEGLKNADT